VLVRCVYVSAGVGCSVIMGDIQKMCRFRFAKFRSGRILNTGHPRARILSDQTVVWVVDHLALLFLFLLSTISVCTPPHCAGAPLILKEVPVIAKYFDIASVVSLPPLPSLALDMMTYLL
jgi:hypothetical protein